MKIKPRMQVLRFLPLQIEKKSLIKHHWQRVRVKIIVRIQMKKSPVNTSLR